MNIRIKFVKGHEAKYISHLDLMRTIQRAMRRAKIPMVYSAGYNPHPEMSFAQALSVGIHSIGEYLDIKVRDTMDLEELKNRLNDTLPKGLKVLDAVILKDDAKSAMALVTHGEYILTLCFDKENFISKKDVLSGFLNQKNIYAMKEQPKKNFELIRIDIKPMIRYINILNEGESEELVLNCILACGSKANLKPELLIQAMEEYFQVKIISKSIKRVELFMENDDELIPLLAVDNA